MSTSRQLASLIGVVAILAAGIVFLSIRASSAGESCQGLDTALQNNLNFIAAQQANPDAQSDARIANRQAVVNLIQQRRQAAGCTNNVSAQDPAAGNNKQGSGENCAGLDKALQNNLNFIAGQKANPDAQSAARIANRQAVVNLIQQRRQAAGCTGNGGADANAGNGNAGNNAGGNNAGNDNAGNDNAGNDNAGNNAGGNAGTGNNGNGGNNNAGDDGNTGGSVVCPGSTVTLSGEGGDAAASSNQFPIGTKLKVTNLDNNQSITVPVTSTSGSCVLLNNKAFNEIHEEGKLLIRRARIEKVG
jgi:hypothetical protein